MTKTFVVMCTDGENRRFKDREDAINFVVRAGELVICVSTVVVEYKSDIDFGSDYLNYLHGEFERNYTAYEFLRAVLVGKL